MGPEVLVVGALHLDVVVDAPHLPALDETVMGSAVAYRFGGKGGNQAVAAARMGARVAMAGRVGCDRFGEMILAALDEAGVDRSGVIEVDGASGMSVAIVDARGDYGAVIVSGVNRDIDGEAIAVPRDAKVVLLQNEVPEAVNLGIAAKAGDARVVLNAAPAREVAAELMARVDILVVNRGEAAMLAATEDPDAAAARLRAMGPETVIVTLGADGLVALTGEGSLRLTAPQVTVVSTHGAGDAFTGALAAALAQGAALPEALVFAQGAAALTVATAPDRRRALTEGKVRAFLSAL
jgi:ribokinase